MAFNGFMLCVAPKINHGGPVRLPLSLKGIYRLSRQRGGLCYQERDDLTEQLRSRFVEEFLRLSKAEAHYEELLDSLDLDLPHWGVERWEVEEAGVEEEWRAVKAAESEWRAIAGSWLKAIDAQPYPSLGKGVAVVVDLPSWGEEEVNGEGDVLDSAWTAMSPLMDEREKEARACTAEGRPLPEWAVELPLAWPLNKSTTSAARESKRILEAWAPPHDGGVRERLIGKLEYLLKMRAKNPLWSYHF